MTDNRFPRRTFLAAAGGSLAAVPLRAYALEETARTKQPDRQGLGAKPMKGDFPVKAIASHNGLKATQRAYELALKGVDTLDAAIAGVTIVEDDPHETSVGYGGIPNEDGEVELDAAVMHGPTHRAGAVAALRNIRNPAQVAKVVLDRSDHVLLVGDGALRFAKAHGFEEENLLTEKTRKIWLYWKETLSKRDDWLPPPDDELDPDVAKFFKIPQKRKAKTKSNRQSKTGNESSRRGPVKKFKRPTGTIHCAAMNVAGDVSCTTTTSGLAFKIPGRVGDSPIIGAGLYVDNEVGSCGSTGRGEANLQNLCCFAAVELMRQGAAPQEAGLEVLQRVVRSTEDRLRDKQGRPDFGLSFYLLSKEGAHAAVTMWGPKKFAVTDRKGTRHEQCASLYENSK